MSSQDADNNAAAALLWAHFRADPAAGMAGLYDRYSKLVYGLARKILNDAQEAEDVTHEVFVSLMANAAYDPTRGSLGAYLCTMARSRSIDRIRSRARARLSLATYGSDNEEGAPAASESALDSDSARAVRAALSRLPEQQRQVVELAYFHGLTQVEIAARMNAPLGTVKSWARYGLFSLRDALSDFEEP